MGIEIERKFLVSLSAWNAPDNGKVYRQGYIRTHNQNTVRIRTAGNQGYLTLKSKTKSLTRSEFEYAIPFDEAEEMLDLLCDQPLIEKIRYEVIFAGFKWEVDKFLGENDGLMLAEIELEAEEQKFTPPPWITIEVTSDKRYYNSNLVINPFSQWAD